MGKLNKLFHALSLVIKQPSLLNQVLDANSVMQRKVAKHYGLPHGLKTIDLLDLFPDFHETVTPFSALEGTSTLPDLALLRSLARSFTDCSYLEIGTWRGESVANVATVAHDCITVNIPDEEMLRAGLAEKYVKLHRFFSKELINVEHIQANSSDFDFKSLNKKFDLIFIDGDHHYGQVKNDTLKAFEVLRNENSIIVWHDYAYHPGEVRFEVLKGILDGCPPQFRNQLYSVSNTLCAIFTQKKYPAEFAEAYSNPNKVFTIDLSVRKIHS